MLYYLNCSRSQKGYNMSRFHKIAHVLWYCQYHFAWTPKYRYRILEGDLKKDVESCICSFVAWQGCEVVELNVQKDHVHLIAFLQPKVSVSTFMGILKGRTAIRIFKSHPELKRKPYWGNHFWADGYCVDTVGLDAEKIRMYVRYQEAQERKQEQGLLGL